TRLFSLLEGRIVETFLRVRMPRRPEYPARDMGILDGIVEMLRDVRTWTTLLYKLLMLPLRVAYFTLTVKLASISLSLLAAPLFYLFADNVDYHLHYFYWDGGSFDLTGIESLLLCAGGFLLLTVTLHLLRGIGVFHGHIARGLLVKPGRD